MAERMTLAEAAAAAEWVNVMGWQVPMFLKEEMAAAARKNYPGLTLDMSDEDACRAVTKFWWVDLLTRTKAAEAEAPVADVVATVREEYAQKGEAAKLQALRDAALITEAPDPPVEPTPTDPLPGGK